jgi:carboxymethylenebutenolidase
MAMVGSVTKAMAAADSGAFLDYLESLPQVSGPAGTTGYCMGGGLSLAAAAHHPERIMAAASFHGGRLATDAPDSPHTMVGSITGRVYVAGADNDASFPPEQADLLDEALTAAGVDHTIETYPAMHGFAVGDSPAYDHAAAERHYDALATLYAEMLGVSG